MTERAEFSAATRRLLAQRAGYQCSVLNCGRLTVGPGPGSDSVVQIGMAAHIYAAAEGGPRGTGGLSPAQRSSPSNGIWCCFGHGKAIDSGGGSEFSAAQLQMWKRLHEARKGAEVHGVAFDHVGLVESILINSAPASLSGRRFDLGMRNIITGPNGSGKSMLMKLIASVSDSSHVAEISRKRDVDIAVRWFDPLAHKVATTGRTGQVRHILDGRAVPYVARPFKTILLSSHPAPQLNLASLAQSFDLSPPAMKATLELLPAHSETVKAVRFHGGEVEFVADVHGRTVRSAQRGSWLPAFDALVLMELAGLHAQHHARVEPTFLILDELLDRYDAHIQLAALERLERTATHAQVAMISHSARLVAECEERWSITELDYTKRDLLDPGCPIDLEIDSA